MQHHNNTNNQTTTINQAQAGSPAPPGPNEVPNVPNVTQVSFGSESYTVCNSPDFPSPSILDADLHWQPRGAEGTADFALVLEPRGGPGGGRSVSGGVNQNFECFGARGLGNLKRIINSH